MKTPKPTRLPSGSYNVRMRLGGQSVSVTRPTKTEARLEAERIKANYRNGLWTKPDKATEPTVGELIDTYIESRRTVLSPSTIAGYKVIRRNRFQDIMKLKPSEIPNWQKVIDDEVNAKTKGKTIHNSWSLVSASLTHAKLPVPTVALPPVIRSTRPWLDADQIKVFVKAIEGNPYEVEMLLGLHSLRRSEIFALTWDKVDLKDGLIHVEGSVVQDENSKQVYKETNKTTNSRRTIRIMIPRLQTLLESVPKSKRKGKIYTQPQNYLWAEINKTCRENNLPEIGCHGLRHSFCSLAHHVGLPEQETMEIGGWESPDVMRKVYQHISAADRLKAENKIAQFFSPDNFNLQNADENSESQANKGL